LIQEQGFK